MVTVTRQPVRTFSFRHRQQRLFHYVFYSYTASHYGGYAFAKLTEQEEIKAHLGVPQIFLGNIGRLSEARFTRYYCNKCKKDAITLIEEGEYRCRACKNLIALYRKFDHI